MPRLARIQQAAHVLSAHGAVIVLNGPFHHSPALAAKLADSLLIAADGGFRRLERLGIRPDMVVGDFDSVRRPDNVETIVHPVEKDETDGELALQRALSAGSTEITVVGALGGRYDMSFGHVALLRQAQSQGARAVLTDGRQAAFLVPRRRTRVGPRGHSLSVIPLTPAARLASSGLRWPLEGLTLRWDEMRGISNRIIADPAWIRCVSGEALAVTAFPLIGD